MRRKCRRRSVAVSRDIVTVLLRVDARR